MLIWVCSFRVATFGLRVKTCVHLREAESAPKKSEAVRIPNPKGFPSGHHTEGVTKRKKMIFGPEGLGAKRTCAPTRRVGVHEPRSEAESAVRKEKMHAHVHGAESAHKSCTHSVHPKGERVKIHAHAPAGCRCTHTQRKNNRTLRPSGARDRVKIAHTGTHHAHTYAHTGTHHAHTYAHTCAHTRI